MIQFVQPDGEKLKKFHFSFTIPDYAGAARVRDRNGARILRLAASFAVVTADGLHCCGAFVSGEQKRFFPSAAPCVRC